MKENTKNDKPDIKNKYYELGWFSTKIKEVKIESLKDICDWINAMCELAEEGSKRQIWGTKKKDDRGMLGILKVCKDKNFKELKNLPHGIFDCVNLKNLLDKINKCVEKTKIGCTHQNEFKKNFETCNNITKKEVEKLVEYGRQLKDFYNCYINTSESKSINDIGCLLDVGLDAEWNAEKTTKIKKRMQDLKKYLAEIQEKQKILVKPINRNDYDELYKQLVLHFKSLGYMFSVWKSEFPFDSALIKDPKTSLDALLLSLSVRNTKIEIDTK